MNCFTCSVATQVINSYGSFFECSAIKGMSIKRNPKSHAAHQIMLYNGQLFIPKCCPNGAVIEKKGEYYPIVKQTFFTKRIGYQPNTKQDANDSYQGVLF